MLRSSADRMIATPVPIAFASAVRLASSACTGTGPAGDPTCAASGAWASARSRVAEIGRAASMFDPVGGGVGNIRFSGRTGGQRRRLQRLAAAGDRAVERDRRLDG